MKAFLYKAKGAVALTLAMTMFCPQVFAVEPLSAEEQGMKPAPVVELTEEELAAMQLPELTYDEALKLAKRHSPDLRDIEASQEYLQDVWEDLPGVKTPTYESMKWVNDGWWALVNANFSTEMGMKQSRIGRQMAEMGLELAVKTYFTLILSTEDALELAEKNAEVQKTNYLHGVRRHQLGMLSTYNLNQLKATADNAQTSLEQAKNGLEMLYVNMNQLIGANSDARYTFVYDVTYAPFEMSQTIDQYINAELKTDLSIELKEMAIETAKFNRNYLKESDSGTTTALNTLNYDQAKRDLKNAKQDKDTLIRNTYLEIKNLESSYTAAQSALEKAKADLRVAELNYQVGNVTKTQVTLAEMGVLQAEMALKQNAYDHDMKVFQFENPSILAKTQ